MTLMYSNITGQYLAFLILFITTVKSSHFIQAVPFGDNLNEMVSFIFSEKKTTTTKQKANSVNYVPRLWILFWEVLSLADKKKLIIYYYVSKLKMWKKW